jgi:hypothetical protein
MGLVLLQSNSDNKINDSSLKTYSQNVKRIGINVRNFDDEESVDMKKIKDLEFIKSSLDDIMNLNTKCNALMALVWFIRNDSRIFKDKIKAELHAIKILENNKECLIERNFQAKENRFKENDKYRGLKIESLQTKFMNGWDVFQQGFEDANRVFILDPKKVIHLLQQYFLVSLYLFSPPLRNNYIHLIYLKSSQMDRMNDSSNYLIDYGVHAEIILNSYKTKKAYGQFRFKLSSISTIIFFKLRELRKYKNGDYVIYNTTTKNPFNVKSTKIISDASKAVLDIKLSCNCYRHMYIVELLHSDKYKDMTVNEKMMIAKSMNHSFFTQQLYNRVE